MEYNLDFFIHFFSQIPEEKWCPFTRHNYKGQHCAYGHAANAGIDNALGHFDETVERGKPRKHLIGGHITFGRVIACINNGYYSEYQQPTEKQRVMAYLTDLKILEVLNKKEQEQEKTENICELVV